MRNVEAEVVVPYQRSGNTMPWYYNTSSVSMTLRRVKDAVAKSFGNNTGEHARVWVET